MVYISDIKGYSIRSLRKWLEVLTYNTLLQGEIENYFNENEIEPNFDVNQSMNFADLATGVFFNPEQDFCYLYPGNLLGGLSCGLSAMDVLMTVHNKKDVNHHYNRISPTHFYNLEKRIKTVSGIKSNQAAIAVGLARSLKIYYTRSIVICPVHPDEIVEGTLFEAMHAANEERLPLLFVVSGYASESAAFNPEIFQRLTNIYFSYCDGSNFFDTMNAMTKAWQITRDGTGPVMLIGRGRLTSRQAYDILAGELYQSQKLTKEEINKMWEEVRVQIRKEKEKVSALESPGAEDIAMSQTKVFQAQEKEAPEETPQYTIREAIESTLITELQQNIHGFYVARAYTAESNPFPTRLRSHIAEHRVITLNAGEQLLTASAGGMCEYNENMSVVVEPCAHADDYWSSLAQVVDLTFSMLLLQQNISLVIRIPSGGYTGSGPYASQNLEGPLLSVPGLRIAYPAYANDYAGLLRTAMRSPGITVLLESKATYDDDIATAKVPPEHSVPFGEGKVIREGKDLTIFSYGNALHLAVLAADSLAREDEYEVEVFDLRSLLPLDKKGILKSVNKTGKALIATESYLFGNVGAEISSLLNQEAFFSLEAPVKRLGSLFIPVPYQTHLESTVLPGVSDIKEAARDILYI
ncbi:MAG: hypothetical protein K9I68_09510 [Bacteroidales bacterium]|nr:hypothetical protein [Bacteroidales bacterium]MCF8338839.1 hypothetical protein [Bacteroidales bacterium]